MEDPIQAAAGPIDPKEREKSAFWHGFAMGFLYLLFLILLEMFVGPHLDEAEAWAMPLIVTGLLVWIASIDICITD